MEKKKLTKEELREIAEKILKEKLSDLVGKMSEDGILLDIAEELGVIESYGGWWRTVSCIGMVNPFRYACVPLQVSEELKRLEEITYEQDEDFEDYVKSISKDLGKKAWNYFNSEAEIEIAYDRDELIEDLILVHHDLAWEVGCDLKKVVEIFLNEDWLKDILNDDYYSEEEVREAFENFFEDNEEAYERLEEIMKDLCNLDDFSEQLEKFMEFTRQYIEEVCKELEEEKEEEEEQHIK